MYQNLVTWEDQRKKYGCIVKGSLKVWHEEIQFDRGCTAMQNFKGSIIYVQYLKDSFWISQKSMHCFVNKESTHFIAHTGLICYSVFKR